jgi:hypothetical protein
MPVGRDCGQVQQPLPRGQLRRGCSEYTNSEQSAQYRQDWPGTHLRVDYLAGRQVRTPKRQSSVQRPADASHEQQQDQQIGYPPHISPGRHSPAPLSLLICAALGINKLISVSVMLSMLVDHLFEAAVVFSLPLDHFLDFAALLDVSIFLGVCHINPMS